MRYSRTVCWLLAVLVCTSSSFLFAADDAPVAVTAISADEIADAPVADIHQLAEGWTWGADVRIRVSNLNHVFDLAKSGDPLGIGDLADDWNYQRYRARLWSDMALTDSVSAYARLTWEYWAWDKPADFEDANGPMYIDNLNIKIANPGDLDATLTIGRQDIILGTGWLVLDGTPLDHSRTIFFDAVRADVNLSDATSVTFAYIDNGGANDRLLGTIDNQDEYLAEEDNRGAIAWLTHQAAEHTQLGAFFIYKHTDALPSTVKNMVGLELPSDGYNSDLYYVGGRLMTTYIPGWTLMGDLALQFGNIEATDSRAIGFLGSASTQLCDNTTLRLAVEYLSGDDPGTGDEDEGFYTPWGRWGRFSDLIGFNYAVDTRLADYSNMIRLNAGLTVQATDSLKIDADYHLLLADEAQPAGPFGDGTTRGNLFTLQGTYQINPQMTASVRGEVFLPGSYYPASRNDTATYLNGELNITF